MPFSFRRDSDTRPSQKSSQMAPCFFRSIRTPTLRPFSSVTNWIPLMAFIVLQVTHRRKTGNYLRIPHMTQITTIGVVFAQLVLDAPQPYETICSSARAKGPLPTNPASSTQVPPFRQRLDCALLYPKRWHSCFAIRGPE